jgi:hypothetical protein
MTEPAAGTAPAAPRNTTAMALAVIGGLLTIAGGFLSWVSSLPDTEGTKAPISLFFKPIDATTADTALITSAGIVVAILGLIILIGAFTARNTMTLVGGVLALIAFVLVGINLMRTELLGLGIGDFGIGLWAIGLGGVLAIVAGVMGRRSAITV